MAEARSYSIARRLAVWGGLSVAVFLGVMATIIFAFSERASDEAYDRLLLAAALSVADGVQIVDGEISADIPIAAFSMLAIEKEDRVFYRLHDDDDRTITGYPDFTPALSFPRGRDVTFANDVFRSFPVRIAAARRLITVAGAPRWVTVVMAETLDSRAALAAEIRAYAMVPLVLVAVAAVVMIPFSIRQALKPVAALERDLTLREPADLGPVRMASVPVEIAPLVVTLNHFVERLATTLGRNRAFLAEAAHQIRTPLASLRSMAEIAATETDPAALADQVRRIHRNAVATARITNQLLADAGIANRLQLGRTEPVRLDQLLAATINDVLAYQAVTSIRLDIAEGAEGLVVDGEPVALREAVRNLIDNAVAYGPAEGPVDVALVRDGAGRPVIEVADRGPGVPDADKARIFGRFERGGLGGSGLGLGLAIVARVAEAHGALVVLADRPGGGLAARIVFGAGAAREDA